MMHRALLRIVLAMVSVIAGIFGGATVATAVGTPTLPSAVHVYDTDPAPRWVPDTADERGPPARTYDAGQINLIRNLP